MIYGRFGNPVTIIRQAVLADVRRYDHRAPDKADKAAVAAGSYWIVRDTDTERESLYHLAYLRADDGSREITTTCNAVGGNSAPADTRPGRHYRDERGFLVGPMICRRCGLQTGHGLLCACERKGGRPNG